MKSFVVVSFLVSMGVSAAACAAPVEEAEGASGTSEQAATGRPACTAANEGAEVSETIRGGYQVLRCEGGAWQLVRRCTNGKCVDY